jgi:hypothetical protein
VSIKIGSVITEFTATDDRLQPGPRHDLCAYVVVDITIDGALFQVGTMIGAHESDHSQVRASGAGVRPFCRTWFADAADYQSVPSNRKDEVTIALFEARHRLWQEVETFRRKHPITTRTIH